MKISILFEENRTIFFRRVFLEKEEKSGFLYRGNEWIGVFPRSIEYRIFTHTGTVKRNDSEVISGGIVLSIRPI